MSAILCCAAAHLSVLRPDNAKYSATSARLLSKTLRLFRQNLTRSFATRDTCDAIAGTSILINYISWYNLGFLDGQNIPEHGKPSLDLSQDQLLLLSPGVMQVFFQAFPVFIAQQSAFLTIAGQHPLNNIETCLAKRGLDPGRYTKAFMDMYDDPDYEISSKQNQMANAAQGKAPPLWNFLVQTEGRLARFQAMSAGPVSTEYIAQALPAAIDGIPDAVGRLSTQLEPISERLNRLGFERVAGHISSLLCCAELSGELADGLPCATLPEVSDLKRLIYVMPILFCGSFTIHALEGDSRALVVLFYFYRVTRILLAREDAWWAHERSRVMEVLMLKELEARNHSPYLPGLQTI